jgi:hypothetical protein
MYNNLGNCYSIDRDRQSVVINTFMPKFGHPIDRWLGNKRRRRSTISSNFNRLTLRELTIDREADPNVRLTNEDHRSFKEELKSMYNEPGLSINLAKNVGWSDDLKDILI